MRCVFYSKVTVSSCTITSVWTQYTLLALKRQQNNCIWKCLFNISIEANIVDHDESLIWVHTVVYDASNILVDDKNIHFVIMQFNGL